MTGAASDIDATVRRGFALHQAGNLDEAEKLYRAAVAAEPRHFQALHLLGLVEMQRGRFAEADRLIGRALAVNPDFPEARNNHGAALLELGRPAEALAAFDRALAAKPGYVKALTNRGNALLRLGRPEESLASHDRALALAPADGEALVNRGNALAALNRHAAALESYDRALAARPDFAAGWLNRGTALQNLRRYGDALASFNRALALEPGNAEAWFNLGNCALAMGHPEKALASYDRALAIRPDYAEALHNRGNALMGVKRTEAALADYDKVLALAPRHAGALNGRGNALASLKRHAEAADCFARLVETAPDYDYAEGKALHWRLQCCDWAGYDGAARRLAEAVAAGKRRDTPLTFLAVSPSPAAQLACARTYALHRCGGIEPLPWTGPPYRHKRIRLAYVSADFRTHATASLMAGLFEAHDRDKFETVAISLLPADASPMGRRIKDAFERWVDATAMTDHDAAAAMRAMEIDIAVDLMGYTQHGRMEIFAHRAAPVQVGYLGYPGTMGAPFVDYIVADRFVIPPEHRAFYAEKPVYMPDCFQVNDTKRPRVARAPDRSAVGLPPQGFVFCAFSNSYKITPLMFDVWMRLLKAVPGSVLWLIDNNAAATENLRREAARRGVSPERLVFAPRLAYADYLARYAAADVFLDTAPFNAGATASDALWAGLPVVTCAGEAFAARMAGSLLTAAGLGGFIARSPGEYEALALKLAADPAALAAAKARLEANGKSSALFDTDRFRRHIEWAYAAMWERQQRGEPPEELSVPAQVR